MDNLIDWFYGQVVGFLGNFFAEMGNMGVELFDLDWVQAIVLFFSQLGWALFGVSLVVCIFECGIDYTTGRANIKDTALNILKGFLSVCLFTTVPVRLYSLSVTLQGTFASGLTGFGTSIGTVGQQIIEDLNGVESVTEMTGAAGGFGLGVITSPIMIIFCVILMAYAVIKVFFSNLKRGGILLIQIAVGSLYMFSIPRGYLWLPVSLHPGPAQLSRHHGGAGPAPPSGGEKRRHPEHLYQAGDRRRGKWHPPQRGEQEPHGPEQHQQHESGRHRRGQPPGCGGAHRRHAEEPGASGTLRGVHRPGSP